MLLTSKWLKHYILCLLHWRVVIHHLWNVTQWHKNIALPPSNYQSPYFIDFCKLICMIELTGYRIVTSWQRYKYKIWMFLVSFSSTTNLLSPHDLTHWGCDKMAAIFQMAFSDVISRMKMKIYNVWALVQLMAWHWPGDKPLSEPMMVRLLMHVFVTCPQWFNCLDKHLSNGFEYIVLMYILIIIK